MKFVKSLFLAIVCVCEVLFVENVWAVYCNSTTAATSSGFFCSLNSQYSCPSGCWCPGNKTYYTASVSSRVVGWCASSDSATRNNAGDGDWGGAILCPAKFPKSNNGASNKEADCYAEIICSVPGKYIKPRTGNCNTACPAGFECCPGRQPSCNGSVRYDNVHYNDEAGITGTCGNGTYSTTGSSSCKPCPSGTSSETGPVSECTKCGLGTCSSKNGFSCAGSGETGAKYCIKCQDNFYQDEEGKAECKLCEGRIIKQNGLQVGCEPCKPGTYTDEGKCKTCDAGYYCPDGIEEKQCPDESTSEEGSTSCYCGRGRTLNTETNKCENCQSAPNIYIDDKGCGVCDQIPEELANQGARFVNREDNSGKGSCRLMVKTDTCTIYYKHDGVSGYVLDPANKTIAEKNYYVETQGVCKKCSVTVPDRPYSDGGRGGLEQCRTCTPGNCLWNNLCKPCSAGFICPGDNEGKAQLCKSEYASTFTPWYGVEICPRGTFSTERSTRCNYCAGNYTTRTCDTGDTACSEECRYPSEGTGCMTSSACVMKRSSLCYVHDTTNIHFLQNASQQCTAWPDAIIEGKIDRTQFTRFKVFEAEMTNVEQTGVGTADNH